jgi:hypothetical protein
MMGLDQEIAVADLLSYRKDASRIVTCPSHVPRDHVVLSFAAQRDEQSQVILYPCADFSGASESRRHLWVAKAPRRHEANAERVLEIDFAMMARRRFWQASDEVQANPQMTLGLDMSRALHRALTGFEPIVDCLFDAARLSKVVSNQLWRDGCGKLCFEHFGDAGVM